MKIVKLSKPLNLFLSWNGLWMDRNNFDLNWIIA